MQMYLWVKVVVENGLYYSVCVYLTTVTAKHDLLTDLLHTER